MSRYTVRPDGDNWFVDDEEYEGDEYLSYGPFKTNADAWRWIDRQTGDPVSAAEKRAQYPWEKMDD